MSSRSRCASNPASEAITLPRNWSLRRGQRSRKQEKPNDQQKRDRDKTGALYVGVGSSGNLGVEPEPKATIQRFDADGINQMTVASGTRNPTALAFHPDTGELWALVQERDGLGDNLPSDYLIRVQQGGFYGWPYAYIGKHPQPGFANLAPTRSKRRSPPICCSRRTPHCSTSSSTRAISSRRDTRAACSSH
jgi:Glucose / Sorbosone dehydrogenase